MRTTISHDSSPKLQWPITSTEQDLSWNCGRGTVWVPLLNKEGFQNGHVRALSQAKGHFSPELLCDPCIPHTQESGPGNEWQTLEDFRNNAFTNKSGRANYLVRGINHSKKMLSGWTITELSFGVSQEKCDNLH